MISLKQFPDLAKRIIIGVGECAHGSSGLHAAASKIIKSGIEDLGARTIGLEAPMGVIESLNKKLSSTNRQPLSKNDLMELYSIWRTTEMLRFFTWIHDFNLSKDSIEEEIQLIGYDVRSPTAELKEVASFFRQSESAKKLCETLTLDKVDVQRLERLSHEGKSDEAHRKFSKISDALSEARYAANDSPRIQFLLDRLDAWTKVYLNWQQVEMGPAYAERDRQMYWLLTNIISRNTSNRPVIIYAHLNHLLFDNSKLIKPKDHLKFGPVLGSYLKKAFGSQYSLIGVFAQSIEVFSPLGESQIFSADIDSFETRVQANYKTDTIVTAANLPDELKFQTFVGKISPKKHKLSAAYSEFQIDIPEQMDFVCTLDESMGEILF